MIAMHRISVDLAFLHTYRLPQVQQMLYDDAQLSDAWHFAIQWLQTEMEKVSVASLCPVY